MSARKSFTGKLARGATSVGVLVGVACLAGTAASTASPNPGQQHGEQREPRIAFSRLDPTVGGYALWSTTSRGTDQRRLTPGQAYFPAWAPNRSHLLFDFPDDDGDEQIGRVDADGSHFQQLTDLPGISEAADYSPDGSTIVFDRFVPQDGHFFTSLYVMNADGSNPHPLFGADSTTFDVEPDYSPDGRTIVFSRIRFDPATEEETYALFITAADGSRQRRITPFAAGVEHPHWSPDGRWVIYDVESAGESEERGLPRATQRARSPPHPAQHREAHLLQARLLARRQANRARLLRRRPRPGRHLHDQLARSRPPPHREHGGPV